MKALFTLIGTLVVASAANASIIPMYSETSFVDAANECRAEGGKFVGSTMETSTATGYDFYIVGCARDNHGKTAYTVAWSATSADNAAQRCETASVTTGLPAGTPVGQSIYANPSTSDIFIILCDK